MDMSKWFPGLIGASLKGITSSSRRLVEEMVARNNESTGNRERIISQSGEQLQITSGHSCPFLQSQGFETASKGNAIKTNFFFGSLSCTDLTLLITVNISTLNP